MAGRQRSGRGGHRYPRTARLNETLREIIADELVRLDDERLAFVTVTQIDADQELNRAIVYFDSLDGPDADETIVAVLGQHRARIQSAIARQIRAKKTPILTFVPDEVIRSAERIDDILRADRRRTDDVEG
jgi:ribosome-binding factor A